MVLCHALDGLYTDFNRKLQIGTLFSDLFKHYALSKAIYDDSNLKNLLNIYKENADDEAQVFFFNPSSINWKDYYMNTHLPGLVKYAIK
ncbi:putative alcohol-forming fatty acyl-CoA reductase [Helianthus debilis subsp. tardiflorus]